MVLIGLGIGASFSVLSNAAIHAFSARQRGSASSTLNFLRSLGMTIGITVFGIIQSHVFMRKLTDTFAGSGDQMPSEELLSDPHVLLSPETRAELPAPVLDKITEALSSSIVQTFAWGIIPAVLALGAAFFMGRDKLEATEENDGEGYSASH
jgi:hypothetical protein